jgi:hypothetical protein
MSDDLICQAAALMEEQARDYTRLDAACKRLSEALISSPPSVIESMTRVGETELFQMRSRMVRIIRALTAFSDLRAASTESIALSPEARSKFEAASGRLMQAAREFQRTRERASSLTTGGATFATALIQMCGIHPSTYRAPYTRGSEARPWA